MNTPQIVRWVLSGFIVAVTALCILEWGPDQPSTTRPSVSMTMAFALVSLTAVNLGVVMRREREAPWSSPMFPYFGWLIAGWVLTWAAVELNMLQRLLGSESLTGRDWVIVIALSLITPGLIFIDKVITQRRNSVSLDKPGGGPPPRVADEPANPAMSASGSYPS